MKYIKKFENNQDYINNQLFKSIRNNDVADVILYLNNDADINAIVDDGRSVFDYAIDYNRGEDCLGIIKELIKRKVNINMINRDMTPLHHAIYINNIYVVKLLIDANADLNIQDDYGRTPLIMCADYNIIDICYLLIEAGAEWNITNDNNKTFIDLLSIRNRKHIVDRYPEMYKEYLMIENSKKFNL